MKAFKTSQIQDAQKDMASVTDGLLETFTLRQVANMFAGAMVATLNEAFGQEKAVALIRALADELEQEGTGEHDARTIN